MEISVIIPIRNEEKHLAHCLESLRRQDYPQTDMEILLVDGLSEDRTCEIANSYRTYFDNLILLENPGKTAPCAMNVGIRAARGRYIVRMDAHSAYADDYLSQCLACLKKTGADNVGGVAVTKGEGFWGGAIALMLSSRFGVGNSAFRVGAADGYVDTVPFGAFPRTVFDKYGYYDERLTRNQDNELNYRIRKHGGKIFLSNSIRLTYFCRNSIAGIAQMAQQNGKWNIITSFLCPGTMGIRHFVPLVFVLSLLGLPLLALLNVLSLLLLAVELALYLALDIGFSLRLARSPQLCAALMLLFPLFHICYGCGSLAGFFSFLASKGNKKG
jgi:hypothetical protein